MHMVSACFPQARQHWNGLSRLYATRGRTPASSSKVKRGKKTAMGGSMTETTHASVRYSPETSSPWSQAGACSFSKSSVNRFCMANKIPPSQSESTLAPQMVIQKIMASMKSIRGNPVIRLVRIRSKDRSFRLPARIRVSAAFSPVPVRVFVCRRFFRGDVRSQQAV